MTTIRDNRIAVGVTSSIVIGLLSVGALNPLGTAVAEEQVGSGEPVAASETDVSVTIPEPVEVTEPTIDVEAEVNARLEEERQRLEAEAQAKAEEEAQRAADEARSKVEEELAKAKEEAGKVAENVKGMFNNVSPNTGVGNIAFGTQVDAPTKHMNLDSALKEAKYVAEALQLGTDPAWDNGTPNLSNSCYMMDVTFLGCNHSDGVQIVVSLTDSNAVAVVANNLTLSDTQKSVMETIYGLRSGTATMAKGTYNAMVDPDYVQ